VTSWIPDQVRGDDGGHDGEWEKALAAFEAAAAEVLRIEAATAGYGLEEEEALLPAHGAACEAMEAALRHMLLAPAPDLAAFAVKLESLLKHALEPHSIEEDVAAAIRADARRLSGSSGGSGRASFDRLRMSGSGDPAARRPAP
jgi:hypothetical protein